MKKVIAAVLVVTAFAVLLYTSIQSKTGPEAVVDQLVRNYDLEAIELNEGELSEPIWSARFSDSSSPEDFDTLRTYFEEDGWELVEFELGAFSTSGTFRYIKGDITCNSLLFSHMDNTIRGESNRVFNATVACQ